MTSDASVQNLTPVMGSNITEVNLGIQFTLDEVTGVTEFTSLYDQFMILGVMVKIIPMTQPNLTTISSTATSGATGYPIPQIAYAVDYDDASNDSLLTLQQRSTTKEKSIIKPVSFYVKGPRPSQTVFGTGYSIPKGPIWINCANSGTPHYGAKVVLWAQNYVAAPSQPTTFRFKIIKKYYIRFRGLR